MAGNKKNGTNTTNIKSMPIQYHIGASKFVNDDWGTIAFSIPRNQIQSKFVDIELRYNFIYFLFGYDEAKEVVYVGQAKKRNDGESVLKRLREHDKSTTERYRDKWSWIVAVTNKDDAWGLDDLNAIEHAFYNEIPSDQNLNGNNPNSGGADYEAYTDKISQIKSLITAVGFNIFCTEETETQIQITSETNEYTIVEDLQSGMAKIPEIVTTQKVVKSMVDMLPLEVWNSKTTFLDMACKGGEYLREIYDRLMESEILQAEFPNIIERSNHILKNQVYGIALSQVSLERTTKKLLGEDRNLRVIPNYIDKLKNKGECKEVKKLRDTRRIGEVLNEEFGRDMKFDVVIGNPPYQENTGGGNGGGANTLYDKFVLHGIELADKYVSFITPARWYTDESRVKDLKNKLISTRNMRELHDFPNTDEVFNGVYIMGGVCHYLYDKSYDGLCKVVEHRDGTVVESSRYLMEDFSDIFIRNKEAVGLVGKVVTREDFLSISACIQDYNIFKLRSYEKGNIIPTEDSNIMLYYTGNNTKGGSYGYITSGEIGGGEHFIDKHKIFINSVSDNMLGFPYKVLYKAFYGAPGTVCNESYLMIGPIMGPEYADSIIKYLATKFVRALVLQRKTSQLAYKRVYKFVPLQKFNDEDGIDWSQTVADIDKQLYKKYGLSQEEIDYIERTIKYLE